MKKNVILGIIALSVIGCNLFNACNKNSELENPAIIQKNFEDDVEPEGITILGEKLENPYTVENMSTAYYSLVADGVFDEGEDPSNILSPTHYYVRFLPEDSTEFNGLVDDESLELFDYPLDYEILHEGLYYHDNSIPEENCTWLYTVVPVNYSFSNLNYEILDNCIIPTEENPLYYYHDKMEEKACQLFQSNLMDTSEQKASNKKYPSGIIKVRNDAPLLTGLQGLKGVKIRTHNIVKIATAYTNSSGGYAISTGYYVKNVHYSVNFENILGFKIWGNLACILPAYYNKGWKSSQGCSFNFETSSVGWKWSATNNATYIYRMTICPNYSIPLPPTNFRIWVFPMSGDWFGSAPMTRQINLSMQSFTNFLSVYGLIPNSYIRWCLPDIFVLSQGTNTESFYASMWHELAHASHYSAVGSLYWLNYISGVISHQGYGDDSTGYNCGYIGVGEMWANFFEYVVAYQYLNNNYTLSQINEWFNPSPLKDIYIDLGLTPFQIYSSLKFSNINRISLVKENLMFLYPYHSTSINQIFATYGF